MKILLILMIMSNDGTLRQIGHERFDSVKACESVVDEITTLENTFSRELELEYSGEDKPRSFRAICVQEKEDKL